MAGKAITRVLIFGLVGCILFYLLPSSPLVDLDPAGIRAKLSDLKGAITPQGSLELEPVFEIPDLTGLRVAVVEQSFYHDGACRIPSGRIPRDRLT